MCLQKQTLLFLLIFPVFFCSLAESKTFNLGTGNVDGVYYLFGEDLKRDLLENNKTRISFRNISTKGTVDNLDRLRNGELDAAIIQNDIGGYIYNGKYGHKLNQEFLAGIPLFTEYLQIVIAKNGNVRLLGDLRLKIISIGSPNSGSYWNAVDLLSSIGLKKGLDYKAAENDVSSALASVVDGDLDAVIYTRASLPAAFTHNRSKLDILPIPSEIVNSMAIRKPYYHAAKIKLNYDDDTRQIPTLSVIAYLVIGKHVSDKDAEEIVDTILEASKRMESGNTQYSMVSLRSAINKNPFPYHDGAEAALSKAGLMTKPISKYYWIIVLILMFWSVRKARMFRDGYDSLGNTITSGKKSIFRKFVYIVADSGTYLYILIIFCLIAVVQVLVIQHYDAEYARELNVDSSFSEVSFQEALIWMFLFMSSGHSGDIFPISPIGQVLVGAMPLVGILTMLGFFYTLFENQRKLRIERMRGSIVRKVDDHVLICGWNEKVPGLIYGLTSKDAPRKRHIVVVAEMDSETPFSGYSFNHKYVSYCRGDSADQEVLEKAQAKNATDAVIVAGIKKQSNRNLSSILTILTLKQRFKTVSNCDATDNTGLFITAEMAYNENRDLFLSCGANAIIPPDLILDRLLACSCLGGYLPDFLLDIMTHDDHSEIYSMRMKDFTGVDVIQSPLRRILDNLLCKLRALFISTGLENKQLIGRSVYDIQYLFHQNRVNLVGVVKGGCLKTDGFVDQIVNDESPFNPLIGRGDMAYCIQEEDALLLLASDLTHIKTQKIDSFAEIPAFNQAEDAIYDCKAPDLDKVLIVGNSERTVSIAAMLSHVDVEVKTVLYPAGQAKPVNDTTNNNLFSLNYWKKLKPWEFNCIVILADDDKIRQSASIGSEHGGLDSETIMIARILREATRSHTKNGKIRIIAEMINYKCRHLFEDARIDTIVPRTVFIERMLTNLVFHHGLITNYIAAILALDDGIFLRSMEIDENCEICNKPLSSLFNTPGDLQVWGYLPISGRESLKNHGGDFAYHFITSPLECALEKRIEPGDVLIFTAGKNSFENTSSRSA